MKNKILWSAAAAVAVGVGACAAQPPSPCPVATSNPLFELPPYYGRLTPMTDGGACAQHTYELFGFQKYNPPGTSDVKLAVRAYSIGAPYNEELRALPADPDGKKLNAFARFAEFPANDGYCAASDFVPAEANYPEVPAKLEEDGGVLEEAIAELKLKHEWKSLRFVNSAQIPGTVFDGEYTLTEDGCTASYKVFGVWPAVRCVPEENFPNGYNVRCDPFAMLDGGLPDGGVPYKLRGNGKPGTTPEPHALGSGFNPSFGQSDAGPITCNADRYCVSPLNLEQMRQLK